ncbi:MAG: IS66 family insertion sequence element accessory protein TnpB [Gammaproteobacteria bacterium]|nr:IS66 family insertion sequence element accessory protein TnpB [Gammaproteobacteria bacterium]
MDASRWRCERVFLYSHPIDMRKGAVGLCVLVMLELGRNPANRSLYAFINRGRDKLKLPVWHLNGYWVLYKRLERHR